MKRILIVDDEMAYSTLLKEALTGEYTTIVANNGKKGLEIALKEKPDLILLDINMPVMDGMTMLKNLRKDPAGKSIPVIMLTNLEPSEAIVKAAVVDHPTSYVIKSDVGLQEFVEKIRKVLH